MKLRVLLVDDEPYARKRLRNLFKDEPDIESIWEGQDGPSAQRLVDEHSPNLLLLDIQMPGQDGFEFLSHLGATAPAVVFVTAFPEHALKAFEAQAVDYLMKPVSLERLQRSLARVRLYLHARHSPTESAPQEPSAAPLTRISVRTGDRVNFIRVEEINWIEADRNYVTVHSGSSHSVIRETLSGMLAQLPQSHFIRVSRSAVVNMRHVLELALLPSGEHTLLLTNGDRIHLTRSIREIEELLRSS